MKIVLYLLLALLVVLLALWVFGPREPVITEIRFDESIVGNDIDSYLVQSESRFDDIRPDHEKRMLWAFPQSRAKTPVSLVYLHGFSASSKETSPLSETVADALSANAFLTRLSGHGRTDAAMAEAEVQDWLDDTAEAIAISERTGAKTVLITVSTGGTMAAIAAMHPDLKDRIDGIVFISPNFGISNPAAPILTAPFAETIVPLIAGATRSFEPENDLHALYWTESYPSVALLPMAAAVRYARALLFERTDISALFIYSPDDRVIRPGAVIATHERWGGPKKIVAIQNSDDPYNHVIAGDALSPSTTGEVAGLIENWIAEMVLQ